jgi:hypothetical protein
MGRERGEVEEEEGREEGREDESSWARLVR